MNWFFGGLVALALALCVVNPAFIPFVAPGLLIGVLPPLVRAVRRSARLRRVLAIGAGVLVAVALDVFLTVALLRDDQGGFPPAGSPPPGLGLPVIEVPVTYTGVGVHREDPARFDLVESVSVATADLRTAVQGARKLRAIRRVLGDRQAYAYVSRGLQQGLRQQGWKPLTPTTAALRFRRKRPAAVRLKERFYPATSAYAFAPPLSLRVSINTTIRSTSSAALGLTITEGSKIVLSAERHTFGATYPAGQSAVRPVSDREEVTIPVSDETAQVEFEVISPWARNDLFAGLATVSLTEAVRSVLVWVLAIALGLASDTGRSMLRRFFGRLFKQDDTPAGPPSPT